MGDYAAVLPLSPPLERGGLRKLARMACLELYRVAWRRAYLATDGSRMLWLTVAESLHSPASPASGRAGSHHRTADR